MRAIFQIKRNLSKICKRINKLDAYVGYVVQIATSASQTWMPSRKYMLDLEKSKNWHLNGFSAQMKATDRLTNIKILPLYLFVELPGLLYILEMLSTSRNLDLLERNLWSICGIDPAHIWCTIPRFSKPMYNVEWVLKTFRLILMCVLLVCKICFQIHGTILKP